MSEEEIYENTNSNEEANDNNNIHENDELNIDNLEGSTSKFLNNIQNQNYLRQISLLEQKLKMQKSEYENQLESLSNQNNILNETEIKLRSLITNKDKAIFEFNNVIKEYQNEIINIKRELCFKEEKLNSMTNQYNSIKENCNTISMALNNREETHKNIEQEMVKAMEQKNKTEIKIKELVNIVKDYSKEVDILNDKISVLEKENFDIKNTSKNLNIENKKLFYENESLSKNINTYRTSLEEYQNMINDLNTQNQQYKIDMDSCNKQLFEFNQKINGLVSENSKLRNFITEIKNEKNKLENEMNLNKKLNENNLNKINQYDTLIDNMVNETNENINIICKWIDNYQGNFPISQNYDLPKIPLYNIPVKNEDEDYNSNRIKLNELKDKLQKIFTKINNEFMQKKSNEKEKSDKFDDYFLYKNKGTDLTKRIKSLLVNDINKNQYFTYIKNIDNEINTNLKDSISYLNDLTEIKDIIEQLLQYLYSQRLENSNLISENKTLKNEIKNYQNMKKELEIKYINKESNKIKENKNLTLTNKLSEENEKLKQINNILEKKTKNLKTDIDLKQMQINNLEEIINRKDNTEEKINLNNSINNEIYNKQLETIKNLEKDKDNLISDNMKLIEQNKNLKDQLNLINSIKIN